MTSPQFGVTGLAVHTETIVYELQGFKGNITGIGIQSGTDPLDRVGVNKAPAPQDFAGSAVKDYSPVPSYNLAGHAFLIPVNQIIGIGNASFQNQIGIASVFREPVDVGCEPTFYVLFHFGLSGQA